MSLTKRNYESIFISAISFSVLFKMDSNENFFQEISEKEIQKPKQTKKTPKDNYFQNLVSQKIPFASKQSFRFNTSITSFSDL